jgi:DNA modification methylase
MKPYYAADNLTLYHGDCRDVLAQMEPESVQCAVTSPPYWSLRDYGFTGQLGLESTPEEYVANMVEVFRGVKRVLRRDGTLWLNIGDSYYSNFGGGSGTCSTGNAEALQQLGRRNKPSHPTLKPKDLVGIPWRLAFALQADGWWLRSDIIWSKANPMPESVTDRPTKSHEYIFLLTKSERYFFDAEAIKEPSEASENTQKRAQYPGYDAGLAKHRNKSAGNGKADFLSAEKSRYWPASRNRRTVWTIPTSPNPLAHFATYPKKLVEPCILAGTSAAGACPHCGRAWERVVEKEPMVIARSERRELMGEQGRTQTSGTMLKPASSCTVGWKPACSCPEHTPVPCVCLDPFSGTGTTMITAWQLGRHGIGIEASEEYCRLTVEERKPAQREMQLLEAKE